MSKAEATDERTVVITLDGSQNRATILTIVGSADLLQGLLHRPSLQFLDP